MDKPKRDASGYELRGDLSQGEASLSGLWLRPSAKISSSHRAFRTSSEFIQYRDNEDEPPVEYGINLQNSEDSANLKKTKGSWSGANDIPDDFDFSRKKPASSRATVPSFREVTSWERWWLQSQLWSRGLVLLILIIFIIVILQFAIGMYFFVDSFFHQDIDPSVCRTEKCRKMSAWMLEGLDKQISPCDDFWNFTCGNHRQDDKGNLLFNCNNHIIKKYYWWDQFARLEADGESVLADLLKKSNNSLLQQTLRYYQACLDLPQRKKSSLSVLSTMLKDTFKDFDLLDDKAEPRLETIASRVVQAVGDYGLFSLKEPINYPEVNFGSLLIKDWIKFCNDVDLSEVLPFIYEVLGIPRKKRLEVTTNLQFMISTLNNSINNGKPDDCIAYISFDQYEHYLDLNQSVWNVYLTPEETEETDFFPKNSHLKQWKLKPGNLILYKLSISELELHLEKGYRNLFKCWNAWMQKITKENIRAVYATFWSLRIFSEIAEEVDKRTVETYKLQNSALLSATQRETIQSTKLETRCFNSLLHQMGYLPIFGLFHNQDIDVYLKKVNDIVNKTATGLRRLYLSPEEGGLPLMSSFYRKRAEFILSGRDDTAILIPVKEDDFSYNQSKYDLNITKDHLANVILWKKYALDRKVNFWKRGSLKGKLVWYYTFFQLDTVEFFESPLYAPYNILKIPLSLFLPPYLSNDILAADFAGSYYLATKAWLALIYADHHQDNIKRDIEKSKGVYTEGIYSDGDYQPCETYLCDDTFVNNQAVYSLEHITPHRFQTNHGYETIDQYDRVTDAFYIATVVKSAFAMYKEEKKRLAKIPYWKLTPEQRNHARYLRLINFEEFSDAQLYFMTIGRHFCRSRSESYIYKVFSARFISAFRNIPEFAEIFHCPVGSTMNPPNKCMKS